MAHAGQELEGPGGYLLRLVQTGAENGGELLEMEATYPADAGMPPLHLHPSQTERFEVLQGAMITVIDGVEHCYREGETFEVPAGALHQMKGDGAARIRWEVRPALRTAEFFERLYGGEWAAQQDGLAKLFDEFGAEIEVPDAG